jgi:hypothetical protein
MMRRTKPLIITAVILGLHIIRHLTFHVFSALLILISELVTVVTVPLVTTLAVTTSAIVTRSLL